MIFSFLLDLVCDILKLWRYKDSADRADQQRAKREKEEKEKEIELGVLDQHMGKFAQLEISNTMVCTLVLLRPDPI